MIRLLPGDEGGTYLIVTDGVQFEVMTPKPHPLVHDMIQYDQIPAWATLCWLLKDDPRGRPNWAGMRAIMKPDEKLSKSGAV